MQGDNHNYIPMLYPAQTETMFITFSVTLCYFDALLQLTTDCLMCHGHGAILNKGVEAPGEECETKFFGDRDTTNDKLML